MRLMLVTSVAVALSTVWMGCKSGDAESAPAAVTPPPAAAPPVPPPPAPTAVAPPSATGKNPRLLNASAANETAPALYKVKFATTKGDFVLEIHRDWAPLGADRFYNLVKVGYFDDVAFFRVIKGFMVQFGIHGDPAVNGAWRDAKISDDPSRKQSNARGMVTFATGGPNTRTTQLFINYKDNANLDGMGFAPIGKVADGMSVVDAIEGEYGEGQPSGRGPMQGRLQAEGNTYLKASFPHLDYIKSATVVP